MARLAIIIGVSRNLAPLQSLAACANDAAAIASVIKQTGRFQEVLTLIENDETESTIVKERISSFIDRHKGAPVEELIFYFSGHGEFSGDEFYHILSDYTISSRNRTSLSGAELDEMMRGLAPTLFVKIVDACHSGATYIKRPEALGEYLKGARVGFKDVYFLYSSQSDQYSWTEGSLSAFTKCILNEISRKDIGIVRYRDIMNSVADHFEGVGAQTPTFVTQADFTQVFCESSKDLQSLVGKYISPPASPVTSNPPSPSKNEPISLLEVIRAANERLCSRDEAIAVLNAIADDFGASQMDGILKDIYRWDVDRIERRTQEVPFIGEWIKKNPGRGYFASPEYKAVHYKKRVPKDMDIGGLSSYKNVMNRLLGVAGGSVETELVDAVRQEISDFESTCTIPFQQINIKLSPVLSVVLPLECVIVPVLSADSVRLFWSIVQYRRIDWDSVTPDRTSLSWEGSEAPLKDKERISALTSYIKSDFVAAAEQIIKLKWNNQDDRANIRTLLGDKNMNIIPEKSSKRKDA